MNRDDLIKELLEPAWPDRQGLITKVVATKLADHLEPVLAAHDRAQRAEAVDRLRAALTREAEALDGLAAEPVSEDMKSAFRLAARGIRSCLEAKR